MKVYIKEPGKALELKEIDNTLEELQRIVGGCIETVTVASDCIIICNEEGRINDMHYNCTLFGMQFFGTLIFAGTDGEEFCDLPDAGRELLMNATKKYTEIFKLKKCLKRRTFPLFSQTTAISLNLSVRKNIKLNTLVHTRAVKEYAALFKGMVHTERNKICLK